MLFPSESSQTLQYGSQVFPTGLRWDLRSHMSPPASRPLLIGGMVPPVRIGIFCPQPLAVSGTGYEKALHVQDCLCCLQHSSTCSELPGRQHSLMEKSMSTLQNYLTQGNSWAPGEWGRVVNRHSLQIQRKWNIQEQMKKQKTLISSHWLFCVWRVCCLMINEKLIQQRYKVKDRDLEMGKLEWKKAALQLL